jgi:hypothetical protein
MVYPNTLQLKFLQIHRPTATGENRTLRFLLDGYLHHSPHLLLLPMQLRPSPRRILIRPDAGA